MPRTSTFLAPAALVVMLCSTAMLPLNASVQAQDTAPSMDPGPLHTSPSLRARRTVLTADDQKRFDLYARGDLEALYAAFLVDLKADVEAESHDNDRHRVMVEMFASVIETLGWQARARKDLADLGASDDLLNLRANLALETGDIAEVRAFETQLGYLNGWCVAGPFDNERGAGFATNPGPEGQLPDFDTVYRGKSDYPVSWRALSVEPRLGWVDLDALLRPNDETLAYAFTTIEANQDTTATLALSSDEGWKMWVNGAEVVIGDGPEGGRHIHRQAAFDQDVVKVPLVAGKNLVMLKITEAEGSWGFKLRIVDSGGATLTPAGVAEPSTWINRLPPESALQTDRKIPQLRETKDEKPAQIFWRACHDLFRHPNEVKDRVAMHLLEDLMEAQDKALLPGERLHLTFMLAMASRSTAETSAGVDENRKRELLLQVLQKNPNYVPALLSLAEHYSSTLRLPERSAEYARRALAVAPNHPQATLSLALALAQQGMVAEYGRMTAELLKKQPTHAGIHATLAFFAERDKNLSLAREHSLAALKLAPGYSRIRHWLIEDAAKQNQLELVETLAAEGLELDPFATTWLSTRAGVLADTFGRERDALTLYQQALAIAPHDDELLSEAGKLAIRVADSVERAERVQGITDIDGAPITEISRIHRTLARDYFDLALKRNERRADLKRYIEFLSNERPAWEVALQKDIADIVRAALEKPANPEDLLHTVYVQTINEVASDGTSSEYTHVAIRVSNDRGLQLRRLPLNFLVAGDLKVVDAKVWHQNGTSEPSRISGTLIDNPNLEVGDVLEMRYRSFNTEKGIFGDYYGDISVFQTLGGGPADEYHVTYVLPANRDFYFHEANGAPQPEIREEKGSVIRSYTLRNLPRIENEQLMPPAQQVLPTVYASTFESWQAFGKWYWNLIERQVKATPAIKAKVAEITEGLTTEEEKVRAIYNFTVTEIRYNAEWEFGVHGYKPYEAGAIFDRCIGDCKDKAILIVTMLREAGITAYPVIINLAEIRGEENLAVAAPYHFNHAIAYIEFSDGTTRFLDGTATNNGYDEFPMADAGAKSIVIRPDGGEVVVVPTPQWQENADHWTINATIATTGAAEFDVLNHPTGGSGSRARGALEVKGNRVRMLTRMLFENVPGTAVSEVVTSDLRDLNTAVEVSAKATAAAFAREDGGNLRFKPLFNTVDWTRTVLAAQPLRQNDLLLPPPFGSTQKLVFTLPEGYRAVELPADASIDTPHFTYHVSYFAEGSTITVQHHMAFTATRVTKEDYHAFREELTKALTNDKAEIELKRGE